MLAIDVNDQNFTFFLFLAYYYINYPAVLLLQSLGINSRIAMTMLLGIPQWIIVSAVIMLVISPFFKRKDELSMEQ